jgi:superfamily II DNA or RNA helicase
MKQSIKITIADNKYCTIKTDNYDIIQQIRKEFSYKLQNVEFTPKFRSGQWNGIIYLLDGKNRIGLGLLEQLKEFLARIDCETVIEDLRPNLIPAKEIDLQPRLTQLGMVLRPYQQQVVDAAFARQKGIVRVATGGGKSLIIAALTAKINRPTLIGVIGLDLLQEFHRTLTELFDEPIGYIGNGICKIAPKINVCSAWTLGRSLNLKKDIIDEDSSEKEIFRAEHNKSIMDLLKSTEVFLWDECHSFGAETFKQIYRVIDPMYIFGFSGTPYREDNSMLSSNSVLGPQIINVSASSLIEQGYLVQPYIKFISVNKKHTDAHDYHSIYRDCIVENTERNQLIVNNTKTLIDKNYSVLILYKQIRHGQILQERFAENGIDIEMLNGADDTKRRDEIKTKVQNGEIKALLASTIFDIGVNIPALSSLVLAGSGKSSIKSLQRIGRVIRKFPGKNKTAIIDFADQNKYLKQHSQKRYETYSSEEGFIVKWPGK